MQKIGFLILGIFVLSGCAVLPPKSGYIIGSEEWQYPSKDEVGYVQSEKGKYIEGLADTELYQARDAIQKVAVDQDGFFFSYKKDEAVEIETENNAFAVGNNGTWAEASGKGKSQQILERDKRSLILKSDVKGVFFLRGAERIRDAQNKVLPGPGYRFWYLLIDTEGRKPLWFSSSSVNALARVAYAFSDLTSQKIQTKQSLIMPVYPNIGLVLNTQTAEIEGIFQNSPLLNSTSKCNTLPKDLCRG
jgi:hypothetical protein